MGLCIHRGRNRFCRWKGTPREHNFKETRLHKRTLIQAALAAVLLACGSLAVAQDNAFRIGLILPMTGPFASTGKQVEAAARLYMAQNGDTVAGKKIQLIVKDDTGTPDVTKRIAQELVVNDKVNVLAGFGLTPLALATAADRHAIEDAAGGHGGRHFEHHAGFALHRAHQLHAAAGVGGDRGLGAQERHQESGHPGHRLRSGHRLPRSSSRSACS